MYTITLTTKAAKQIKKLSPEVQKAVMDKISTLSREPRGSGAKKLSGFSHWRIRNGDYRIIYDIQDKELLVLVIKVGHRRDIYKK